MTRILVFVLISAFAASPSLVAWNETGHRAIALLAYEHLTPSARKEVSDVLTAHPHAATLLREDLAESSSDEAAWIFANASKWPDDVRKPPYAATFHRPTWHWVNIPYVPHEYAGRLNESKIQEAGDIVAQINRNLALLGNRSAARADRAVALCWVAHLIEDIHQPLHAAALITPELPKGDQGGNLLGVRTSEKAKSVTNLHSVWDSALGRGTGAKGARDAARRIRSTYPNLAKLTGIEQHTTPRSWAEESYVLAIEAAYLKGTLQYRVTKWGERPDSTTVPALPSDYQTNARGVADQRAAQAAWRLALAINEALGT